MNVTVIPARHLQDTFKHGSNNFMNTYLLLVG